MERVLVTGGTRGIGAAIAIAFMEKGYKVAVTYKGNIEAAQKMESDHGLKAFCWDVSNFASCENGIAQVEEWLQGNVQILINNAGITRDAMLHKQTVENWEAVIATNLGSVFNMSRAVISKMRNNKEGCIVSISSVNAHGMLGQTNYSAAKAGIEGFTKSLALENAVYGIRVNAVAPGYVNTEMVSAITPEILQKILQRVPMARLGEPKEIANAVLFLASSEASFITGAVIPVNGGLHD